MWIPLVAALIFFLGVGLESVLDLSFSQWMWFVPFLIGAWKREVAFLCIVFLLSIWRTQLYEASLSSSVELGWRELSGQIVREIDRRSDHQKITIQTEEALVLARISPYEDLEFGDHVRFVGELQRPSEDIDGFNYSAYLARHRIALVMNDARLIHVARGPPGFRPALYRFKSLLEQRINRLYMEPEASFVAGLLLGSRKGMPQELADAFQRVGLTHIVAISGYNISLVILLIFTACAFLSLRLRIVVSSLAIAVFVLLVGASAAVVRAGIMGVLTLWAMFSGRKSQVFFVLLWSALIMVIWNPYTLVFDVGFQLSFASTMGLLVFGPILDSWTEWWQRFPLLKEALLLTVAAQIATFPIIAYEFGRFSLIAPIANLLVAPFLPMSMLSSALALIFGLPMVLLSWFPLKAVEWVALFLAELPYIDVPIQMDEWGYFMAWLGLGLFSFRFYKSTLVRAFHRVDLAETSMLSDPQFERHEIQ